MNWRWIDGRTDGRTDRRTDGRTTRKDGRTDGQTDGIETPPELQADGQPLLRPHIICIVLICVTF